MSVVQVDAVLHYRQLAQLRGIPLWTAPGELISQVQHVALLFNAVSPLSVSFNPCVS